MAVVPWRRRAETRLAAANKQPAEGSPVVGNDDVPMFQQRCPDMAEVLTSVREV